MTRSLGRATAAAIALLCAAAFAAAGCGLGPGADVGAVELAVTREYGSVPVLGEELGEVKESDTVMRLLESHEDITTRYGGGFVQSIDGVEAAQRGGDPYDWFFYVNGVESPIGAAEYSVQGGEKIWWDYRDWAASNSVPAVVGSWPAPLSEGYEGTEHPVALDCEGAAAACESVREALEDEGVKPAAGSPKGAIRVLVGPWPKLRSDPTARLIEAGPAESGVYAGFAPDGGLEGLDPAGDAARKFGPDAGLVAATRRYGGPPVWIVTGSSEKGVEAAAALLNEGDLRDHYAVAVDGGVQTPLPVLGR